MAVVDAVIHTPRDLAHGGRAVKLVWHKRRWRCRNPHCPRGSFTEQVAAVPARSRRTSRLRAASGAAVGDRGATVVQAGRDLRLSWPTVWKAFETGVFLSAVRQALPHATIVVDHFHVVQLANTALTEVRRSTTWQLRGRRGCAGDGEWDVRRLLTRNRENLSERRFAKMWNTLVDLGDPGGDILAAYIVKEKLRELLALACTGPDRHRICQRLFDFYHRCAHSCGSR